ncbi:MAG TPA: HNH endonuclease [Accumulibacter sp.]|nr:HNH endonuclease [Accumulibacter sp.]
MWQDDLDSFSRAHNITPSQAKWLKCTAEHLEARQDGGLDTAANIVAACLRCNRMRHLGKRNPSPSVYAQQVRKEIRKGRWHCAPLLTAFGALLAGGHDSRGEATS